MLQVIQLSKKVAFLKHIDHAHKNGMYGLTFNLWRIRPAQELICVIHMHSDWLREDRTSVNIKNFLISLNRAITISCFFSNFHVSVLQICKSNSG